MERGWTLLFLWFLVVCCSAQSDFFTSVGHMTDLLFTEKDLVLSLKDYIIAEESKLHTLRLWADRLESLSAAATEDPERFLGNPVNAFKVIKRLNSEWSDLEALVLSDTSHGFISNLTIHRQYFPTDEDQTGAANALIRLQDTYQLDTETISTGALPGSSLSLGLSAEDCFDLGKVAYSEADYLHTAQWMEQALKQLQTESQTQTSDHSLDQTTVLDYLSYSVYQQGALEQALLYTRRLLQLDPGHQRALGNLKYFEYQLSKQQRGAEPPAASGGRPDDYLPERKSYEKLCRGEGIQMTPQRRSRLFCRYHNNHGHPSLLIGPVKQEVEWDRPLILRYHDVVSEREMEKVKELAKPRLRRATVHDPQTGKLTTAHYRVSKSAWLGASEHPLVDRINQRIQDVTGLDVSTAEDLQVANYGVGGQYEPHFDFGRDDEPDAFEELGTGNRIATWLLYMSDVQAGGATVFTDIGAALKPKKGSAVFWYNLFPSGEGDYRTRHAACPVLVGNKWVSNKWIHERGQEFRRRCGLRATNQV